jgi:methyltransferase-like protein
MMDIVQFVKNNVGDVMRKKNKLSSVVRIRTGTSNLLKSLNTKTIDDAIMKLWNKLCVQGKVLNQWRKESACADPEELRKLLDTLYTEINILREKLVLKKDENGTERHS